MILNRLLYQGFGVWRLAGGLAGALLGWMLVFGGMQLWFLIEQNLIHKGEFLTPEYYIINKPVPLINLSGAKGLAFTEDEIETLKKQRFVKAVAPFVLNRFRAAASFGSDKEKPLLATDLFFEAVPDAFLDVKATDWQWREGETNLPIIIPRDYLALYNFGFAQSQKLPQISESLASQVHLSLLISGKGKESEFKGRIVGFSDRLNSILAPYDFLIWANGTFGEGDLRPLRLIVKTENPNASEVLQYFTEKQYQYNTEKLKTAKLGSALRLLLYVVSTFGLVVLILAFWILALSFQLLIARNNERLKKLIWIGYHPGVIVNRYMFLMLVLVVVVNVGCLAFLGWGTGWAANLMSRYGYAAEPVSLFKPVLWMAVLSLIITGLNYAILRKQVYRLA